MKILYISGNQRSPQFPWLTDYQDDCLLLGLKELFGDDVVDCNKRYHLYSDYSDAEFATEYGKGFTICRNITSDNCDREDIIKKIKNKFFDLVVYGSIWRCQDHLELVLGTYDKKQIMFSSNSTWQQCSSKISYPFGIKFEVKLQGPSLKIIPFSIF